MKGRALLALLVAVLPGIIAGCVSEQSDAGFGDVKKAAAQRGGVCVEWKTQTPADQAVDEVIQRLLLQKELRVEQATQIALLNNRSLQATFEELGIAQADLVEAGLLKNPVLSAEFRLPGEALEIDLFQDVLDVFIRPLRKRVAQSQFEAAKLHVSDAVLDLWTRTRVAYYTLQGAQQMLELRRSIVQATEASAEAAKKLYDAGNIKDADYGNEQAMHEEARMGLARAEAEVLDARERLNALMGLWGPDAQRWMVAARLPELPQEEVSPVGLETQAVLQRLDLAAARQETEALARSYGLTKSTALIPEIRTGVHDEREPDGKNTIGPSIEFPLPIFNQGQASLARAQAKLRQAQQRYIALAVDIRSEVRTARNRMLNARNRADYYRRVIVPLRHRIVEQTQLQFNAMQIGVFQLLEARQGEIEAGRAYIDAMREYWIARAELERAVGGCLHAAKGPATRPATATAPATEVQELPTQGHIHHGGH